MRLISCALPRLAVVATLSLLGFTSIAKANTIAVTNGNFQSTSLNESNQIGYHDANSSTIQTVTGWTNATVNGTLGYSFLFQNGSAVAYGNSGNVSLWTTSNGGVNTITASPAGGNFVAMDGAYQSEPFYTTLTGLTVGSQLTVSFYYAGAQQTGYYTPTTEGLTVSLYNPTTNTYSTQAAPTLNNAAQGFTGWNQYSVSFTPTSTTELLGFLATGTPGGEPPFTLLDGVTAYDNVGVTPEPSSFALLGTGVLSMAGLLRRRYAR